MAAATDGAASPGLWQLRLQQQGASEPLIAEVPVPHSLEELRASLGVEVGHVLLLEHARYPGRRYAVESLDQVHDGATLQIYVPRRRIYISVPPDTRRKAVMWYPGATVNQIELAIAKAAGFPVGAHIELRDGDATVVLSTTIPDDTHLEVFPYSEPPRLGRASGSQSPTRRTPPVRSARTPTVSTNGGGHSASAPTQHHQQKSEDRCISVLAGHTGFIFCLCVVGDILFTGSQDSHIMIWDLNNLQYIGTLPGHRGFVKCLFASYGRKLLASGSQDRTLRVWSLETFSVTKVLYGHTGAVNAVLMLDDVDILVSGSEDRSIRVWDLATYESLANIEQAHLGGVFTLERLVGPSGQQVVSGARDRSLKVWDSAWHTSRTLHPPHYDGVTSIAAAPRHGKFYSGSRDRSIKEWDMAALTNTKHTLHVHMDWVQALCMSVSEDVLFSGSRDGTVKVWDGELQCRDVLQGHRGPVSAVVAVGDRLFSASHDRTVRVWQAAQYG